MGLKGFLKKGIKPIINRLPIHKVIPQIVELKQDGLLQGRTALVTGGTSGIGNEIAKSFLQMLPSHQIDILVNNAGVSGDSFATTTEEEYNNTLDTNLKGVYFLSQYFAHYYIDNNIKGNILYIASSSSSSLRPVNSAYALSKWGIRGLTEGLARFLAPYGITVNGIAPGQTMTPMMKTASVDNLYHPTNLIGRYILPVEIANMAVVLV